MRSAFLLLAAAMMVMVASVHSQLNPTECGTITSSVKGGMEMPERIVGGTVSATRGRPYQVEFQIGGSFACGGSLVNTLNVLTAAHCTAGQAATRITLRMGHNSRSAPGTFVQSRGLNRIQQHTGYNSGTYSNDISMLRMASAVVYSTAIRPICLTAQNTEHAPATTSSANTGVCSGWGTTSSGGQVSDALREVVLFITSYADCRAQYGASAINAATMICGGIRGDNKDSCQGDSGGPYATLVGGKWTLFGVVSWGAGCGDIGVYARVASYHTWALQQVTAA